MNYKYFTNPHLYSSYNTGSKCDLCGFVGAYAHYDGMYCDKCVIEGKADGVLGRDFNDPEIINEDQQKADPDWAEKLRVLSLMTPPIQKWQDWVWPYCCSDYCVYICELSKERIREFAKALEPDQFIGMYLQDGPDASDVYEGLRDRDKINDPNDCQAGLHLFRCNCCAKIILKFDAN